MQEGSSKGLSGKLKVVADPVRLSVLTHLLARPRHVGELAERLGVEQSLLSHHLRKLRQAELVVSTRDGKSVLYRVAPTVARGDDGVHIDLGCCRLSFDGAALPRAGAEAASGIAGNGLE